MSNLHIRMANPDDAVALARLGKTTFLDTYAAFNQPEHIQEYVAKAFNPAKTGVELQDQEAVFLVAERDSRLIAYAKIRTSRMPAGVPSDSATELERIYVSRAYFGNGIGRMLIDAAVVETLRRDRKSLWLGVWKANPEAVAFYRKCGFEIVGSKVFMMGPDPQEDHVMLMNIEHTYDMPALRQQLERRNGGSTL